MRKAAIIFFIGVIFCWMSQSNYNDDLKRAQEHDSTVQVLNYKSYWGEGVGAILCMTAFVMAMKYSLKK